MDVVIVSSSICIACLFLADRDTGGPETQGPLQSRYGSFEDLRKALPREVTPPGCRVEDARKARTVLINGGNVQVEVAIQVVPQTESANCMVASVKIFGIPAPKFPAPKFQCNFVYKHLRTSCMIYVKCHHAVV